MRSQSGPRNRIVLLVLGALALTAAAWLAAAAFDLAPTGGVVDTVVPVGSSTPASLLGDADWALPVGIAVSVIAVLGGLALLVSQVPTAPARAVLRLHDADGAVLATLEPQVLERALVERIEDVQGVDSASVRVTGSATSIAVVAVAASAQIAWTIEQVRHRLFEDLQLSLGSEPRAVDVLVSLSTGRSTARADRVAVGGEKE